MIFENPTAKTVILSARKCGLITLGATVTKPGTSGVSYKNRSASLKYIFKSLDPWVEDPDLIAAGKIKEYPVFDKSSWKDYDVTLFIREPYERYISGLVTCWIICWKGDSYHVKDYDKWADDDFYRSIDYYMADNFKDWFETAYSKTGTLHLENGHLKPFLHKTEGMQYKTLKVYDSTQLSDWLIYHGYEDKHLNKSIDKKKHLVIDYIEENYKEQVLDWLSEEQKIYRNLLDIND